MKYPAVSAVLVYGIALSTLPLAAQSNQSTPPAPNVSWGSTRSGSDWTSWAPHDTGFHQADPALVVGNDRLLTGVEAEFNIFFNPAHGDDQYGNFGSGLGEWLGPALPAPVNGFQITEPQFLVDPACQDGLGNLRQCYILIARATRVNDQASRLIIAASYWVGPQEWGSWNMWSIDVSHRDSGTATYPVFPRAGDTANAIVVAADMYAWEDNSFQYAQVWSFPKSALYPGGQKTGHTVWAFANADGSQASSLVPAISYVNSTVTYLVNAYYPGNGTANQLSIRPVDTTNPAAPVFGLQTLPVADFSMPPAAEQRGTNTLINTGDAGITNAVLLSTGLWAAQGTGCTPDGDTAQRSCARWYQIDPAAPAVLQQGTLGYAGAHFYYPAIAANENGAVTLAFSGSASYAAAGIYYSGRRASDPPNTLDGFALLHDGDGCYVRMNGSANKLGGRTAVALDLSDRQSMWIFGAFASGSSADCRANGWGTWLGRVTW
jgi:hypothetical protein